MAEKALVSVKHKRFAVPFNAALAKIVPTAIQADDRLILPHTIETTKLARNVGFRVPSPILCHYDWCGTTPFRTQKIAAAMHVMHRRAFNLSEMGTGKTRAALYAIDYLIKERIIRSALIVAPLSTLSIVWDREIMEHFPHLKTAIVHGSKAERRRALASPADIYIINHDGVKVVTDMLAANHDIDAVVIDEVASFRNASTERWKAMARVLEKRRYVWGLTGSPTPNEPTDAYGQIKLLMPNNVPRHFGTFKALTMRKISTFVWVPKPDANDLVFDAMQPAVRFTRADCVELPPATYVGRQVEMSSEQARVYDSLLKNLRIAVQEGTVSAANEGVLFNKLVQISSGWVYTSDRKVVDLQPSNRLDVLRDVIYETPHKVIVFVSYLHAAERVAEGLQARHVKDLAVVTGDVSKKERDRIFTEFQNSDSPRVLVAHPQCMAHGLTLTAANTIVWYTPTSSLEHYEQACARITRPSQKNPQLFVLLTGSRIEAKIYRRLQQKARLQGALLEMFEQED